MCAVFLDMDEVVAYLERHPDSWTLGPHCEIASDPGQWGHSMTNNAEILLPCLDTAGARSVIEVGAYAGDLTRLLLDWATGCGARLWAIDPSPQPALEQLAAGRPDLELVRAISLEALPQLPPADAVVIDGDHNYYTVSEELRLVAKQAGEGPLPLVLLHDVRWPHARRDHYSAPLRIPEEHRQPFAHGGLFPGDSGLRDDGLPYTSVAITEGGPRNGVLTAVEDFVGAREHLVLAIVPMFFGVAVVWDRRSPWAGEMDALIGPYDRHPVLERLEANRVLHLALMHSEAVQRMLLGKKTERKMEFMRRLEHSRAFALAERLSRLRQGGDPYFSRAKLERLLNE